MMDASRRYLVFISLLLPDLTHSVLPTAGITIKYTATSPDLEFSVGKDHVTLFASQASFGSEPAMADTFDPPSNLQSHLPTQPPNDNSLMCDAPQFSVQEGSILLVPRGVCSFAEKTLNAQNAGASAIIIYGTLTQSYSVNETTSDIIFPQDKNDYDCDFGSDEIALDSLTLPYSDSDDAVMKQCGATLPNCQSQRCLLTGNESGNDSMKACCAWDMHIWLYGNNDDTAKQINIPALYVTMAQIDVIFNILNNSQDAVVEIYQRWRPEYNYSGILIWALGVFVAWLGSYLSAGDIRSKSKYLIGQDQRPREGMGSRVGSRESILSNVNSEVEITARDESRNENPDFIPKEEEELELQVEHAFFFIIFASASLFILFFFKIYNVVKIMYAFGCSGALTEIIFKPLYTKLAVIFRPNLPYKYVQYSSAITGYTLGAFWLFIAFTQQHPDTITFFWIMQDIMGVCICVTFLKTMKINALKVATVLLGVAFFYDIFFVFVTPYIFKGKSIMVTVATSGGPPTKDPSWCEKYPNDPGCQGGDPLPMLFTVPRFGDYQGGSSLLGLGDIVLPGLLLSFAARLDEAKKFVGLRVGGRGTLRSNAQQCMPDARSPFCVKGYFIPTVIAYAIGLLMANVAVYVMEMGQPALLYLVPLTVGTIAFLGFRQGELKDLWEGPRVLRAAEDSHIEIDGHDGVEAGSEIAETTRVS